MEHATGLSLPPLNRDDPSPLWSQVKSALSRLIMQGGLAEHMRLPSEAELCEAFSVSRTVVREALSQLVHERLIYKLQGKGAFVAGRQDQQDFIGTNIGFTGEIVEKREEVTRRVLRQLVVKPNSREQKLLRVLPDTNLVAVDRVLGVAGTPRWIVRWRMPEHLVPGLENVPLDKRSLYDTLGRQYGVKLERAERWIEAVAATREDAELLRVAPGTPLLAIESIAFSALGEPIEYYTGLYRTDLARMHLSIASPKI